jgi:KamA family protein
MHYQAYNLSNFRSIPQMAKLSDEQLKSIQVVGSVLPFKSNNYVVDNLIDWERVPEDPMFILTFPQKGMLKPEHYRLIEDMIDTGADTSQIRQAAEGIRVQLNPHPAGQMEYNVPIWKGETLNGFQHKYRETVVFFPSQGQTCHAYCTFCFRWPQFAGMKGLRFASSESSLLADYVSGHPEISDVLITGGDPLTMKTRILSTYIEQLLSIPHLRNIRIGTKTVSYWPYRFVADDDAEELLMLFRNIKSAGKHLAIMAHFNHPVELEVPQAKAAIKKILDTGAVIRTQSPLLGHINDSSEIWAEMWRRQVALGCIPYYMFVARNTGAQHYFAVPLVQAWNIFRGAYQRVSGICRTVRGPVMSCSPGKIQLLGVAQVNAEKVMAFRMIQGRDPDWVARPFFSRYDENAVWYRELKPAFGEERFFYEDELDAMLSEYNKNETEEEEEAFE